MIKSLSRVLFVSIALLVLLESSSAQNDEDAKFSFTTFLSRNFNPGISVGVGGGHVYHYAPVPTLKVGALSLSGMSYRPFIDHRAFAYQAELELFRFQDRNKVINNNTHFTLAGGQVHKRLFHENGDDKYSTLFGTIGLNKYLPNGRSKISLKLGYAYFWSNLDGPGHHEVETHDWGPYGELSYKLYLLKIQDRQRFRTPQSEEAGYLAYKEHKRRVTAVKYPSLSQWFNPYWSNGLGLDRVGFLPAGGVKVGPFSAKFSGWVNDVELFTSFNVNYDWYLKSSKRYAKYLSVGAVYTGVSGADCCSGGSDQLIGGVIGYSMLKNSGRHGLEFKAGMGTLLSSSWYLELSPPHNYYESNSQRIAPIVGFSYNLYFFRFLRIHPDKTGEGL